MWTAEQRPLLVYQTLNKEFSSCGNNIATCSGKTVICTFPLVRFVKVAVDILYPVHFALPRQYERAMWYVILGVYFPGGVFYERKYF